MNSKRIDFRLRPSPVAFTVWATLHALTMLSVYHSAIAELYKVLFICIIVFSLILSWFRHAAFRLPRLTSRHYSLRDDDSWLIHDGDEEFVACSVDYVMINRWWISLVFRDIARGYAKLVIFYDSLGRADYDLLCRRCKLARLKQEKV